MNIIRLTISVICLLAVTFANVSEAKNKKKNNDNKWHTLVAVVVDPATYNNAKDAVDKYIESIKVTREDGSVRREGLLVVDRWAQPDSIRNYLYNLYQNSNLEGAVLVGDIPVAMVRDAQHLTTAFKMEQGKNWQESSVPSDRFYDCFTLKFNFIKQDKDIKSYFYYSLAPEGAQQIVCDIYTARIKPPVIEGKTKYRLITEFLNKAVAAKENQKRMNRVLYFAGHGYNSESYNARIEESIALTEQFPFLTTRRGANLSFIDFTFDKSVKHRVLAALGDPTLDLAVMHHHGSEDTQYFNGSPYVSDAKSWINLAKNFFRGKLRRSKDTTATKERFMKEYGAPAEWLNDAFTKEMKTKDSLYSASMDLMIPDMKEYVSGSKIVLLDACYNGSFHMADYIAGHHLFAPGNTIFVKGNSVNTLQDTWTNELLGVLNYGVCVGNWGKGQLTLESHFMGDPTFSFLPDEFSFLDEAMTRERNNPEFWRLILAHKNIPAELVAVSLKMLHRMGGIESEELLDYLRSNPSCVVRLMAFNCLKERADGSLLEAVELGMTDSYELLQRLATLTGGKNGSPALVPILAKKYLDPVTSARVFFQLGTAIEAQDSKAVVAAMNNVHSSDEQREPNDQYRWPYEDDYKRQISNILRRDSSNRAEYEMLKDSKTSKKDIKLIVKGERNGCRVAALDGLFYLLSNDSKADNEIKVLVAETLGWYRYSYKKDDIIERCKEFYAEEKDPAVKAELLKTLNRLK